VIGAAVGTTAFPRRETVTVTHTVTQTVAPPVAPSDATIRDSDFTWKEAGKINIVVIGAGPAGATFVKALAAMPGVRDKVTVTAIEQNEVWISGPPHVDFVIGIRKVEEVMGNVKSVVVDPKVVRLVQARVVSVDPANRVVYTNLGKTSYDLLVLAPGIVLADWRLRVSLR
jgi:NADH dehydrogenase FAD-containing subunit